MESASKPHAILIRHPFKPRTIPLPLDNNTMTFIRFTVPSDEVRIEPHVAAGLFHATYRLARDGRFEAGERLWFEEEMAWFNQFLPATRALPTWRAVCWFRSDAGEAISRIWRIVDIVEGEGVPVRVFRTRRPGQIVYADPFQVAAVPWRDSFTARPHAHRTGRNMRWVSYRACWHFRGPSLSESWELAPRSSTACPRSLASCGRRKIWREALEKRSSRRSHSPSKSDCMGTGGLPEA